MMTLGLALLAFGFVGTALLGFTMGRFSRRDDYARGKRDGDHEGFMRGVEAVRRAVADRFPN